MIDNLLNAKIIKGIGGFYYTKPLDSSFPLTDEIECKLLPKLKKEGYVPTVGDIVGIKELEGHWFICELIERKNCLVRPRVSNVDIGLLCISAASPKPDLFLLDKLILNCFINKVTPIICVTKIDLNKKMAEEIKNIYSRIGIKTFLLTTKEDDDLEKLKRELNSKTSFLAGGTGVGKSTLSNRLCNKKMEVGELSRKLKRGKHTTRHVELLETIGNGFLLDTPGFTTLDIDESIEPEELKYFYPDFIGLNCYFNNCNHINEPNCQVREKVKNHEINKDRYLRYKELFNLLSERKRY